MPRIKIKDLPRDTKISKEEMKAVMGGYSYDPRVQKPSYLAIKPEALPGAYNTAYFSLHKLVQD
ncbi:MAG: hypothetical protein PVI66_15535 [Candidatus Aminicenantes bacterium]|jgi:hypothetical protein